MSARLPIEDGRAVTPPAPDAPGGAAVHALFWLMAANAVGVWVAALLLVPEMNRWTTPLTYGRWMPLHLNWHLYGWGSLPLLAWLFHIYGAEARPEKRLASCAVWAWSLALGVGAWSWLGGQTSGKIFLDWRGIARWMLVLAMGFLWLTLAWTWVKGRSRRRLLAEHAPPPGNGPLGRPFPAVAGLLGLVVLAAVPWIWFWAAGRDVYPSVNPDSGGPTGASLLGSTLIVLLLLLVAPRTFRVEKSGRNWAKKSAWGWFGVNILIYSMLDKSHTRHTDMAQILGLGSLVPWFVLLPAYYGAFHWPAEARRWTRAFLFWFGLLALTGWLSFLPGWLDRLKFSDGLVAHSHLAMAGFMTSFNLFLLVMTHPDPAARAVLARRGMFWLWQAGLMIYLMGMWLSGWNQSVDPGFTIAPAPARDWIYLVRLICGAAMATASVSWWLGARRARSHTTQTWIPTMSRDAPVPLERETLAV